MNSGKTQTGATSQAWARIARGWHEFVGPEATGLDTVATLTCAVAGAVAAPLLARRRGMQSAGRLAAVSLLAADLFGGAWANNTKACARWYERPGQGDREHLVFAAAHLQPLILALLDHPRQGWIRALAGAGAHYGFLLSATALIRRNPEIRRPLGLGTTALGVALDGLAGPSRTVPWFAAVYYPKLLLGHAAAALWSDETLHREGARSEGVPLTPGPMTGFPTVRLGRRVDAEDVATLSEDE